MGCRATKYKADFPFILAWSSERRSRCPQPRCSRGQNGAERRSSVLPVPKALPPCHGHLGTQRPLPTGKGEASCPCEPSRGCSSAWPGACHAGWAWSEPRRGWREAGGDGGDAAAAKPFRRSSGRARGLLREAARREEEHPRRLRRQALTQLCFLFQQSTLRMDIEDCNGRSYISGTSDRGICRLFGVAHVSRRSVLPSGCKLSRSLRPSLCGGAEEPCPARAVKCPGCAACPWRSEQPATESWLASPWKRALNFVCPSACLLLGHCRCASTRPGARSEPGWKEISRAEGAVLGPGHPGALPPLLYGRAAPSSWLRSTGGALSVTGGLSRAVPRKAKAALEGLGAAFWGSARLLGARRPRRTTACDVPSPRRAGLCWDVWGWGTARCGCRSRAAGSSPRVPERQEAAGGAGARGWSSGAEQH